MTQSNVSPTSSARFARTRTLPTFRDDSRKNTAFRWCDSINVTEHSGRNTATGKPGKPAPDPTSAIRSGPAGNLAPSNSDSQ
jgi:hypothetical protein